MAANTPNPAPQRDSRGPGRGPARGGRRGRPTTPESQTDPLTGLPTNELVEKIIFINRSAKVVKGGRRFSFSALVVCGDKKGRVGIGLGKAGEVAEAIKKGTEISRQNLVNVFLLGPTIPHQVLAAYDGARVLIRPASPGTGLIAGKTVRAVLESAGVRDVLTKSLGSKNPANVAKATLGALLQLRLREHIAQGRGITLRPRVAVSQGGTASAPNSPV